MVLKNRLKSEDRAIHNWYRFVLAYPPHLVREYLLKFGADPEYDWVYDPFSGTATTPLEARLNGFSVIGTDSNPIAVLANRVKLNWAIQQDDVKTQLYEVVECASSAMLTAGLSPLSEGEQQLDLFDNDLNTDHLLSLSVTKNKHNNDPFDNNLFLSEETMKIIPKNFISPIPLKRVLAIRFAIESRTKDQKIREFLLLALAHTVISTAGNIAFGPEIYSTKPQMDAPVLRNFFKTAMQMIKDLQEVIASQETIPPFHVFRDDARKLISLYELPQIGIVITSPPYPNEKDYTRTTRLENVLLGYLTSRADLRDLKQTLLRSNTRNVFVKDGDDKYIRNILSIRRLAEQIENRRQELGKTSGFEKLYHRVVTLYFGGMYRHLRALYPRLRNGGKCAYVVGDQMSFFRILIPTAQLLADVALEAGYKVEGIEPWRDRFSTTTKKLLAENVLILKKPE